MNFKEILEFESKHIKKNKWKYVCIVTRNSYFNGRSPKPVWWCSAKSENCYMKEFDYLLGDIEYEDFYVWDKEKKAVVFMSSLHIGICKGCALCT